MDAADRLEARLEAAALFFLLRAVEVRVEVALRDVTRDEDRADVFLRAAAFFFADAEGRFRVA